MRPWGAKILVRRRPKGSGESGVGGVTLAQESGDRGPAEELAGAVELGFEMDAARVVAAVDAHRAYG